ncbi:uncharacterized protein [Panulirus ornatus]|uniref:uncharacterized protein n=1 Tax=Panulirus ornatus TaxID=150431 RepID=UPI003A896552
MPTLKNSWVPAEARQTWKNLEICQVEDAGTLWVREIYSDFRSKGSVEFLEMEKQMNCHFKDRLPRFSLPQFPAEVGSNVVIHHRDSWFRGRVENIIDCDKDQEAEIFLLDYGIKVKADGSSVVCLHPGEWESVPYQAQKIHLFGVLPISLEYVVTTMAVKVIPRKSLKWDQSATDFVRKLFHLKPCAEFTPILYGPDGCLHGVLTLHLTKEFWDVVPHSLSLHHLRPQEGLATLDLAKILVSCDFATLEINIWLEMIKKWENEKILGMGITEKKGYQAGETSLATTKSSVKPDPTHKLELQTDSLLSFLDQKALPSSEPVSLFSQIFSNRTCGKDFHGTINRLEELGLITHSVARGRGLMNLSFPPCGHSTPSPSIRSDQPQNSSTDCRSPSVSLASISSISHLHSSVSSQRAVNELSYSSRNFSSIYNVEEIPPPTYGKQGLISRLVMGPVKKDTISDHAKPQKFSPKTENSSEVNDGTSGNKAMAAFPDVENNIDNSNVNAHARSGTMVNKFAVAENIIRFPLVNEKDYKLYPKISSQERHPPSPARGSGRGLLRCNSEKSLFREDSSKSSHINSHLLGKQGWNSEEESQIPTQEKKIVSLRNDKTSVDIDVIETANGDLEFREIEISGNSSIQPSETSFQGFRSYGNMKNHTKVTTKNLLNTDIPQWVSTCLLDTMLGANHPEHGEMGISVEDVSVLPECSSLKADGSCGEKHICVDKLKIDQRVDTDLNKATENGSRIDGVTYNRIVQREKSRQLCDEQSKRYRYKHNSYFMSDTRDVWTNEFACDLEGEFAPIVTETHPPETPNIAKMFRVFVAGESPIAEQEVIVNENMMSAMLNTHIVKVLYNAGMKATRLQAYMWPAIVRGSSVIVVGGTSCGKTLGYIVPLLSTILDTWQHINHRLVPGIGAVMVVICKDWRNARCVADYIVNFLPANCTFKIMTAWGGCGHEETKDTKMQLLGGCDILITTAPYLLRLLMGKSGDKSKDLDPETLDIPVTSMARCCHLVIDDADSILENFSCEVKQLLMIWGEGRKECERGDLEQQLILVSSRWTKNFDSLTHTLIPLMDPTVIVSAPGEAAIGARVTNSFHVVLDEGASLEKVVELIQKLYSHKKNLVFVINDLVAEKLKSMLESTAIYSLSVSSTVVMWDLQHIVQEWHKMKAVTMIVCKGAENYLLRHDLSNADVILHTYITQPISGFMLRYGFMVDKFSTDLNHKSPNCESHLIVSKDTFSSSLSILNQLDRLFDIPEELFLAGSLYGEDKPCQHSALCYYLKAYGRCPVAPNCGFRHAVQLSDIPYGLPRMGEVTFDIIKILNASRYLVRLTEYREKAGTPSLDLRKHYLSLFLALQLYFGDSAKCEPIKAAEPGMLCAVKDDDVWVRAQIVRVLYSKSIPLIVAFLVDEGKELHVKVNAAFILPPYLAAMPELIVEVYLCRIQPVDHNREWTLQASQYIHDIFFSGNKFVGRIALALGLTLWLSPLTEFAQVGKMLVQKGSIRARLITEGFGTDNPSHLEKLEHLCSKATISLDYQSLCMSDWKNIFQRGYELCSSQAGEDSCITALKHDRSVDVDGNVGRVEVETYCRKEDRMVSNLVAGAHLDEDALSHAVTQDGSQLTQETSNSHRCDITPIQLVQEDLPLEIEVRVEIGEIESPSRFFVLREDKFDRLECLELQLENLAQHLETSIIKADNEDLHWNKCIDILPSSHCIAKFTDDRYYRGLVDSVECNGCKKVFFVDHGETLQVQSNQVHACPVNLLEMLPAQAIPCTLAHVIIPANLKEEATKAMLQLADTADIWSVKVVQVQETAKGKIYSVELFDNICSPPKEMWRELVCAGLAIDVDQQMKDTGEGESLSAKPIDDSLIEDKEAVDFLFNIPSVKKQIEKKKGLNVEQPSKKIIRKEKELCKDKQLSMHHASSLDLHHMLNPSLKDRCGDNRKKTVINCEDIKMQNGKNCENNPMRVEKDIGSIEMCDLVSNHGSDGSQKKVVQQRKRIVNPYRFHKTRMASEVATDVFQKMCLIVPPLEAVEGITCKLFPETSWSQTEDSVVVNIHLFGVEMYKCRFSSSRMTFMTLLGENFYVFDEDLAGDIDVDHSFLRLRGTCVSLTLRKAVRRKWDSLLANGERRPLLRAEYQALLSDDDDQSSKSEENDNWIGGAVDSPVKGCGGLPAGISDSDISYDELSDEDDFLIS